MQIAHFIHIILFCLISNGIDAQWNLFEASWKGKPGKMLVNMGIGDLAPIDELGFLMEVSQGLINCDTHGYPSLEEAEKSEKIAMFIDSLVSKETYVENVGRFSYQCQIKDYFYVQDSNRLKKIIYGSILAPAFDIKIIKDADWKVYKDFIYPDEYLIQTMVNNKIISILRAEGQDLDQKRVLTHYSSFASEDDRNNFRRFLIEQNFKILELDMEENAPLPYLISFTRSDKLLLEQLSNITLRLHQRSESLNGTYDGWELEVQ